MPIAFHFINFWLCHPALLYGIAFLLGLLSCLECSYWIIIPCLFLWLPFLISAAHSKQIHFLNHFALSLLVFLTGWSIISAHYAFPQLPIEGIQGKAYVKIKNINLQNSLFGSRWIYRCELKNFYPDNSSSSIASSLPCLITMQTKQLSLHPRPSADQDYWVQGKLIQTETGTYILKVSSKTLWLSASGSISWAEIRYRCKDKVNQWIQSQFSHPLSGSFLAGLATGEFDDFWMRQQFARFGLQHLLAISGFHFAIIAGFLSFIFRFFFSNRIRIFCLLICLGIYCVFLGPQASILRAWLMCTLTLIGGLIDKQTTALNSLGFALLGILGYNPLLCQELGFQLSFATTAAILLFYQPADALLIDLLPKRRLSEVIEMNQWNQHGYCILAFLRQGLALTLAVNIVALPLTLYYFHQFPFMSLLYNLFFPFLTSGSICLLLFGGLLAFIPYLAKYVHFLNDEYTYFLLQLTYQIPSEMDIIFSLESLSLGFLTIYLSLAVLLGIYWREKSNIQPSDIFAFI